MRNQKGFTLIEILLSLAVAAMLFVALSSFFFLTLQAKAKSRAIAAVEQSGLQILTTLTQTIRDSQTFSAQSSVLTLDMETFQLVGSDLRVTQNGTSVDLNPDRVTVANLNFQDLSRSGASGLIRIELTLTYQNPENRTEFDYTKNFISSAALRTLN